MDGLRLQRLGLQNSGALNNLRIKNSKLRPNFIYKVMPPIQMNCHPEQTSQSSPGLELSLPESDRASLSTARRAISAPCTWAAIPGGELP